MTPTGGTPPGGPGEGARKGPRNGPKFTPRREGRPPPKPRFEKPPLEPFTTTLWTYPSQHYAPSSGAGNAQQGRADYTGATPSWVVWQLLHRYTAPGDLVVDPMVGSGTTLDVAADLGRRAKGFDLQPTRPDIAQADARHLPLPDGSADFVFLDPPYSTHVRYSGRPECIGTLDALPDAPDQGQAYYDAMAEALSECVRVLKPGGHLALYVSDSWKKRGGRAAGEPVGSFAPIGFTLFMILSEVLEPIDHICVVRGNAKLGRGNWHAAAREQGFLLRGFNHLMVFWKPLD